MGYIGECIFRFDWVIINYNVDLLPFKKYKLTENVGKKGFLKKYVNFNPYECYQIWGGKKTRIFVNVIKDLEIGRLPWVIGMENIPIFSIKCKNMYFS